ncbi:MAG: hypothetical protein ACJA0N_002219, partial [Pseudohongiellaceae bacterium]
MTMPHTILDFWFKELTPKQWWVKDNALDELIRERFLPTLQQAAQCELYHWRSSPQGRLAEVIVLDQFSRNIFRDQPQSFANDSLALALAQEAIAHLTLTDFNNHAQNHQPLNAIERSFLYLPFMHSESAIIHQKAVELYTANGIEDNLVFEYKHQAFIDQFGRYPHRNAILGRASTADEIEFL